MSKYRFAVTGAQGVGKTTLAHSLVLLCRERSSVSCEVLHGIGQHVKEAGYPLGLAATADTIYAFAAEHMRRERNAAATLVIQDRCLLDLLAYDRVLGLLGEGAHRMLEEVALTSFATIDSVLFIPMCDSLRNSGTGLEPHDFRARVDAAIPAIAQELGINIVAIEGKPDERVAKALGLVVMTAREVFDIPMG